MKDKNNSNYLNNPFNYIGGKFDLIPQLLPLFPDNINNYIELFGGGYTVGLNVKANKYFYNEKCIQMANLVKTLKDNTIEDTLSSIYNYIEQYSLVKGEPKLKIGADDYNLFREVYNDLLEESPEKSLMLYTLMCFSFSNQYGFNNSSGFNIPKGHGRSDFNQSLKDKLALFVQRIKEIDLQVTSKDFTEFKDFPYESNDFVYLDPPYILSDSAYDRNIKVRWNGTKEKELLEFLDYLNSKKVNFLLSNVVEHKGKINEQLLNWSFKYNIKELKKDYNNCNYQVKKNEGITREVIVLNYPLRNNIEEPKIISIDKRIIIPEKIEESKEDKMETLEQGKIRKVYDEAFKIEMVRRLNNGESNKSLREVYGFSQKALSDWNRQYNKNNVKIDYIGGVHVVEPIFNGTETSTSKEMNKAQLSDQEPIGLTARVGSPPLTMEELLKETEPLFSEPVHVEEICHNVTFIIKDENNAEVLRDSNLEGVKGYLTYLAHIVYKNNKKVFTIVQETVLEKVTTGI